MSFLFSIMLDEMDKADDIITSLPLTSQITQMKTESLSESLTDVSLPCKKQVITTCLVSDTDGKTEDMYNSFGINHRSFLLTKTSDHDISYTCQKLFTKLSYKSCN